MCQSKNGLGRFYNQRQWEVGRKTAEGDRRT